MESTACRGTGPWKSLLVLIALSCALPTEAAAQVAGAVRKTNDQVLQGTIRWQQASKVYVVTDRRTGIQMRIPASQVKEIRTQKPPGLDDAVQQVKAGRHASAVGPLEKILKDYQMLQWDVAATRWLAEAYLGMGQPDKAVRYCETITRENRRAAVQGDLASIYWEALLQSGKTATLKNILSDAVKLGSRELAARAQIKRGDIDRQAGEYKLALLDGYLRTIVFFDKIQAVQPEALFKAAQCFDELGQAAHAEKMRRRLRSQYPQSSYAKQLPAS